MSLRQSKLRSLSDQIEDSVEKPVEKKKVSSKKKKVG